MLAPEVWTCVSHWLEVGDLLKLCWTSRLRYDGLESVGQLNFTEAAHCNISFVRLCPQVKRVTAEVVKNGEPNAELSELLPHVLTSLPKLEHISFPHWHSQVDSVNLVRVTNRLLNDLCMAFRAGHLKRVNYILHGCHCCLQCEPGLRGKMFKRECICGRLIAFFPVQNLFEYIGEHALCVHKGEIARIALKRGADVNRIMEPTHFRYHESKTWFHWLIELMFNYSSTELRCFVVALNFLIEHGHAQITMAIRDEASSNEHEAYELFESIPHDKSYAAHVIHWVSESGLYPPPLPLPAMSRAQLMPSYKTTTSNVPVLSDPNVSSKRLDTLPQGTIFVASDERVQLCNGRRFLRLADRPAWVGRGPSDLFRMGCCA
eukprot:gnl/MRDRNA2_/MRDRNA2_72740_c0_seq1.p1 gnl/MRDRNA2_/MRDRNA2_72740_c0~~gnl/MRDRNA2_/MRDRNA2_72740_c0_seq1.p1  ORF type:complete len:376 (+),score=36.32 gnl/MRDRNA2_/MRDRNA2_72740_c0_seq1:58-1185(+)